MLLQRLIMVLEHKKVFREMGSKKKSKLEAPPEWLYDNIAEISRLAKRIFAIYLFAVGYWIITIFSTSHKQLILNQKVQLPIFNLQVSLNGFFFLYPIACFIIFTYLQIYLHKLKSLLGVLKTKYSKEPSDRIYPWIFNFNFGTQNVAITQIHKFFLSFSLWYLIPIVAILNSFWFVKKHDLLLSILIGLYPLVLSIIILIIKYTYESETTHIEYKSALKNLIKKRVYRSLLMSILIYEFIYLLIILPISLNGGLFKNPFSKKDISIFRNITCIDLSYQKLIEESFYSYKTLYWLNLKDANLQGANLRGSIFEKTDFSKANFLNADLSLGNFNNASFHSAKLSNLIANNAQFEKSIFSISEISNSSFNSSKMPNANFYMSNIRNSYFKDAILRNSSFDYAKLDTVIFQRAKLDSCSLFGAQLNSCYFLSTNLRNADFSGADLRDVIFTESDLLNVHFTNEQLKSIKRLNRCKLDSTLYDVIKSKNYYWLLQDYYIPLEIMQEL